MTKRNRQARPVEFKKGFEVAEGFTSSEFKAGKKGLIEGYGSIFGNIDGGYDIVEAGAFKDSLNNGQKVKMLWQHNADKPIGVWDSVIEDEKGLRVKGSLLTEVETAREALALLKAGAIDGLSIGYRTLEWREAEIEGRYVRIIEKAELWEVSLVTFPMNAEATVDAVKAASMSQRDFGRQLVRDSKMSRRVVEALMRDGWKGVQALSESGGDDIEELALAVLANVKRKQKLLRG